MNPNYSASRFSTYNQCLLKYKYSYIDDLVVVGREFAVQKKGTVFHQIAEETQIGESFDSVKARAEALVNKELSKEELEKYPVMNAIPGFYFWWQTYVEPYVKDGYKLYKEQWERGELDGAPIVGALDVCLVNEEKKLFHIYDYKTGSAAKISDGYKNQLLLYVYMLSKKYDVPEDEITKRFECYLYYPLTKDIRDIDINDEEKIKKLTLKNTLRCIFTDDEYQNTLKSFRKIIADTKSKDWASLDQMKDGNMSFSCSYCQFCGHPRYCALTNKAGMTFPHSAKIMTKDEAKALKND